MKKRKGNEKTEITNKPEKTERKIAQKKTHRPPR
jgi:hypothetical protein